MGVNSLPKTVTRQRRGCDLNPDPSAPESSMLTTRLPSHPYKPGLHKAIRYQIRSTHRDASATQSIQQLYDSDLSLQRRILRSSIHGWGWLGSRVVSVLDSGAEGPGFKSQPRRCRVTVIGKLLTPIVPLFTKQQNW